MKKKLGMLLAVLLTFCVTVGVFADAGKTQQVDYKTDYYMIVESPDGGVDMYSEADASSPKLNDELIPNGTAIHVEGEVTDEAGKVWVYAQLHGMFGFLEENYLNTCQHHHQAILRSYSNLFCNLPAVSFLHLQKLPQSCRK